MSDPGPTRTQGDLAETLELLLDKGVVINADIVVSIGDTELLGVQVRAAIASFETAAKYGLSFPTGTDTERVETAAGMSQSIDGAASTAERSERHRTDSTQSSLKMGSPAETQTGDGGE